jgi:hypothetical protein
MAEQTTRAPEYRGIAGRVERPGMFPMSATRQAAVTYFDALGIDDALAYVEAKTQSASEARISERWVAIGDQLREILREIEAEG